MKKSSTNTTSAWRNKNVVIPAKAGIQFFNLFLKIMFTTWIPAFAGMTAFMPNAFSFQTEFPESKHAPRGLSVFERIEAGLCNEKNDPLSYVYLANGEYVKALESLTTDIQSQTPWLKDYLVQLTQVFEPLEKHESEHFLLWTPPGQSFLADYALPTLEQAASHLEKVLGHRLEGKIRVEIYPNKEDFSAASTLSLETLERSGAIGICKFRRLMIMSPKSLPLGYRWLDALSHEYMHLIVNELSYSQAELWLHEGTARYFETAYRLEPPEFLTPDQKTKLLDALEKNTLVTFARMSPSMVYLKDQEEVTLAFAEVSHAVSVLVKDRGATVFAQFLRSLRKTSFKEAFARSFGMSPSGFESFWQSRLSKEKWEKSKGTMSDEIRFTRFSEEAAIGADAQGQVRMGDKMRQRNLFEAALIQYEKALEQEPDNAVILLKAAKTHLSLGQLEKAVERLKRAVEKNPNYETPRVELAQLVPPDEALPHLIEANAINPFDPRIHALLRDIYVRLGRESDSKREGSAYDLLSEK